MSNFKTREAELAHYRNIDTQLAELYAVVHGLRHRMGEVSKWISDKKKYAAKSYNQNERYQTEAAKLIAGWEETVEELKGEIAKASKVAQDFNAENYTGWSRFFLVKHIHNTHHCSSFRPTTRVGWLPDVSGLTEAEAVAAHGETLCTICFPTAPVELTVKPVDESICEGSGRMYDPAKLTGREKAYYSPSGTCGTCGTRQSLAARGSLKIRKHKKPTA